MKAALGKRIVAATLGVLVSASASVWSMGHRWGMDQDPSRMLEHMADRLELTDSQQVEARQIFDGISDASKVDRKRLDELRDELKNMRENFDPGRAQKIADEIGEITSRMVYRFYSSYAEFHALLTDEQKAQLEELQEQRGERREQRREKYRQHRE